MVWYYLSTKGLKNVLTTVLNMREYVFSLICISPYKNRIYDSILIPYWGKLRRGKVTKFQFK